MLGGGNVAGPSGLELQAVIQSIADFKNEIFAGEVTTPIATHDGRVLTIQDGEQILACKPLITRKDTAALEAQINALASSIDKKISAHNVSEFSHPTHLSVR